MCNMNNSKPHISVVIPIYNCSGCIDELYRRLVVTLDQINSNFEIIMVNDASPQNDWELIKELINKDGRVKGINFSRNFGQHYAITAGLEYVLGDWVIVMDGDLQDQPEEILKLYTKAQEGYDIVFARRSQRKDVFIKKIYSNLFNGIFNYLADISKNRSIGNFSICSQEVIRNVNKFTEQSRSYPHFLIWMGFNYSFVDIEHTERLNGKSSYNFSKGLKLATDVIVAHSNKPLRLSIKAGFIIAAFSMLYGLLLIIRYLFFSRPPSGWTSVIVAIFFVGGLLFIQMGIMGLYIGKIFDETKGRPIYIEKEKINIQ